VYPGYNVITPNNRAVVTTAACNACHAKLAIHGGGSRVDAQYCTTCHTSQAMRAGGGIQPAAAVTVNFSVMVHGIHAAKQMNLNYSVNGITYKFGYPQDVRNCTTCHVAGLTGSEFYKSMPGAAACTGCHESTKFYPDAAIHNPSHQVSATTATSLCTQCHTAVGVGNNHLVPGAAAAADFNIGTAVDGAQPAFAITSVTSTGAGQFPVVTFRVLNPVDSNIKTSRYWTQTTATGSLASSLTIGLGWKTGPYTNTGVVDPTTKKPIDGRVLPLNALTTSGNVNTASIETVAPGTFKVTSKTAMPTGVGLECNSTSSSALCPGVTVEIYGRAQAPGDLTSLGRVPLNAAVGYYSSNSRGSAFNVPTTNRATAFVSIAKCNACHKSLSLHGGSRQGSVELCASCHNTEATFASWYRPSPTDPATILGPMEGTVDFKVMVHEIHNGRLWLTKTEGADYPAPIAYCQACHVNSTSAYFEPIAGSNGTSTQIDPADPANNLRTTPWFATCGSCHTAGDAIAHQRSMGGGWNMTQAEIDALEGNQLPPALKAAP
jgi:OmcA/MtrC family decaheme c-type cytochrome